VADVDSPDGFRILHRAAGGINEDVTFFPKGRKVVFAASDGAVRRLLTVDRDADRPPQPLPGVPDSWQVFDCDLSPDGRRIVFSAIIAPEPVDLPARTDLR
ncbi:MAG: hypothetical protein RIK87_20540, partial [Fuerstiella sp.]